MNCFLLRAEMLQSDATIQITQSTAGLVNFAVGAIGIEKVTNLQSSLTTITNRIDGLEQGSIDLGDYQATAGIKMTAQEKVELFGTAFEYNGKTVVVSDDITDVLRTTDKDVANGVAGLTAQLKLKPEQIPFDTNTMELKNGVITVKTVPIVNNHVASEVTDGVPVLGEGDAVEVGDLLAIAPEATSNAGSVYYRYQETDGTLAADYINLSYTFNPNMDSMTQGTNNKFLSAAEYNVVSKFSLDENADGVKFDGQLLLSGSLLDSTVFAKNGSVWGLADGGVAFAKLVQTGAVPAGWTIAASQVTGLDVGVKSVAFQLNGSAAPSDLAEVTTEAGAVTINLKLSNDFDITTNTEFGVAINAGTGVGQFLKFATAATLPALNGAALTGLNASNLASGTVPAGRLPAAGATAATKGAVYTEAGSGVAIAADGKVTADTNVVATKASVDELATKVTDLTQAPIPFNASSENLAEGVLTISAKRFPTGISKTDYTNYQPVAPSVVGAPNEDGVMEFKLNFGNFEFTGEWQVLFF